MRSGAAAAERPYEVLKAEHAADHRALFRRVCLDLGSAGPEAERIPTDARLARIRRGKADPSLAALFFQYRRYLLIASSRPGDMPANLQGLWAWQMAPPWNADYHLNINLQMNYWPAETCNLAECHVPLFDLMDGLVEPGGRTARAQYGARGWLAQHPWEHFAFGGDREFLARRAWPLMKGAARFILDFLVEAPPGTPVAGKLVTCPSHSPENAFVLPSGSRPSA